MTQTTPQEATLDLLVQVNKLLREADQVKVLRDRLIAVASEAPKPHTEGRREAPAHA
jgi:hypothetical protein